MGRLLDEYLANNVPALQDIVGGQEQPEGATTFPLPEQPPELGQPIGPGGAPTGPMAAFPPGGINPQAAAAAPTFETPGAGPQPAIPPVTPQQQPQQKLPLGEEGADGPDSFQAFAKDADPKKIDAAVKAMEKSGVNIDEEYAQVTGTQPEESEDDPEGKKATKGGEDKKGKLTRQEKGMILMEFGLSLMAASGTGEGTLGGDIGRAGAQALGGFQQRKAAKAKAATEAEERAQKRRLTEAQIKKAERPETTIKADAKGNYIIVDEQSGESKPVMMDGKPVQESNQAKFASEVDRQAYEALECEGMKGAPLKACKRRALAYGKGGGAKVAFPELERADQVDRVMKNLEDPNKASAKYQVPSTGEKKRWKAMTPDEQVEVAEKFVERRMEIINRGEVETGKSAAPKPTLEDPGDLLGDMPQEARAGLKPGTIYTLSNGKKVRIRENKVEEVE